VLDSIASCTKSINQHCILGLLTQMEILIGCECAKRGLLHTSDSINLEECNLGFKAHLLTYAGTHHYQNFKATNFVNLKLQIVKVDKLDVFENQVTNIVLNIRTKRF